MFKAQYKYQVIIIIIIIIFMGDKVIVFHYSRVHRRPSTQRTSLGMST